MGNRKIKFRAWSKLDNKMFQDVKEFKEENWAVNKNGKENKIIVMQYSGLTDIHDEEIYEGDLMGWEFEDRILGVVTFEYGMFCLANNYLFNFAKPGMEIEIKGNIHENPELIENDE